MFSSLKKEQIYNQKCLEKNAQPEDFFKEMAHTLDLKSKIFPKYLKNFHDNVNHFIKEPSF